MKPLWSILCRPIPERVRVNFFLLFFCGLLQKLLPVLSLRSSFHEREHSLTKGVIATDIASTIAPDGERPRAGYFDDPVSTGSVPRSAVSQDTGQLQKYLDATGSAPRSAGSQDTGQPQTPPIPTLSRPSPYTTTPAQKSFADRFVVQKKILESSKAAYLSRELQAPPAHTGTSHSSPPRRSGAPYRKMPQNAWRAHKLLISY